MLELTARRAPFGRDEERRRRDQEKERSEIQELHELPKQNNKQT